VIPTRAVVFDLGGVLTTSPVPALARLLVPQGHDPQTVYAWFTNPTGAWAQYETGQLTEQEVQPALEREAEKVGLDLDVRAFLETFFAGFEVRPKMVQVVESMKGRARLGCLTNTVRRNAGAELFGIAAVAFDAVVASCEVGMRKPAPDIYDLMCRKLGVGPAEVVFLDDHQPNVQAAREVGMTGLLFTTEDIAIRALEEATGFSLP
jgi:epoxide hydrolase-like predicted phosphatase